MTLYLRPSGYSHFIVRDVNTLHLQPQNFLALLFQFCSFPIEPLVGETQFGLLGKVKMVFCPCTVQVTPVFSWTLMSSLVRVTAAIPRASLTSLGDTGSPAWDLKWSSNTSTSVQVTLQVTPKVRL